MRNYIKRKEKIIIDSIQILDEAGIHGLTTRELAKREGITEPAIYRQFDSKKDILLAILKRFSEYDDMIKNTIIYQNMSPKKAVIYFVEAYATYYYNYPQIVTVLFSFDVYRYENETKKEMKEILNNRLIFITEVIKKGQTIGEFSTDIEAQDLAEIVLGLIWSMTYNWKLEEADTNLKDHIMKALDWVLR